MKLLIDTIRFWLVALMVVVLVRVAPADSRHRLARRLEAWLLEERAILERMQKRLEREW